MGKDVLSVILTLTSFLNFDSEVNNNEEYDSIDLFSRDEEDRYFAGDYSDNDDDWQGD